MTCSNCGSLEVTFWFEDWSYCPKCDREKVSRMIEEGEDFDG